MLLTQVAFPVTYFMLPSHSAGTGALLVGLPLVSAVMIGSVWLLSRYAIQGSIVSGVALTALFLFLAVQFLSSTRGPSWKYDDTQKLVSGIFAALNGLGAVASVVLTVSAVAVRRRYDSLGPYPYPDTA